MSWPPLTSDTELADFPGAPYPDSIVRAAEASIRRDCGNWHIAPEYRESVIVECNSPFWLLLPTRRIVTLHSVVEDDTATTVTGCRIRSGGTLLPPTSGSVSAFVPGYTYTVEMTHGFASADDLVPTIAARCQRSQVDAVLTQRSETVGQRTSSESYNINRLQVEAGSDALSRFRLPPRFGA
jgi:hypothetical protein